MIPSSPADLVQRAVGHSRWLAARLQARPELAGWLAETLDTPVSRTEMADFLGAGFASGDDLNRLLRRLREKVFARVMVRDLGGLANLAEVTGTLTTLAEVAVSTALDFHHRDLAAIHGEPLDAEGRPQRMLVVGMGKLGGGELNASSDIDLIFVFAEDGDTAGPRKLSNFEFFTRLGKRLIASLDDKTGDGYVFRVDMRLRPYGGDGPLASSFAMLEEYFYTQAREWERYAWIKGRALTGDRVGELEALRRPFVYRKYLDFGAFGSMRDLHAQIRREVARKDMAGNIKLGPGGIREIEFIAQVFQLIRGGRDRALQVKPTLKVLSLVAERGILDREAERELASAYEFLRRLEHRLQYLDDAQTHHLPGSAEDQALVARAMGFSSYDALLAELDDHRANVSRHFEAVFADPRRGGHHLEGIWRGADGGDQSAGELAGLGFRDGPAAAERLAALRSSPRYHQMPDALRGRCDALVPQIIAAAAAQPDPDATLQRMLALLEAISRRGAYLALLQQYPQALEKVAHLVGSSSWAAGYLQRHPVLLDELLDARILETAPDWPAFRTHLADILDEVEPDMERQMDLMREAHHAKVFRLLTQDLSGLLPLVRLSDHLSELADIMLEEAIKLTWRKVLKRHRDAPRFAIASYGKLGGKELGYASDLDLVFLYDDDAPEAPENYARLATRLNNWLSAQTSAGQLFETDLRLRPNGESGLVVSSMAMFRKYQLESAWVWEHQALTRARFSAGDPVVGRAFEDIRIEVLRQKRDLAKLAEEVLAMRRKMTEAHGTRPEQRDRVFNLKHDPGGLIDVEFIVQFLILGHAHDHPELTGNLGNIALLGIAAELGLIPRPLAEEVREAYREYRRLQHALRLNGQKSRVEPGLVEDRIAAVRKLWDTVFA